MPNGSLDREVSTEELLEEVVRLRRHIEELEQEKFDLETLLEMTTEHSDTVEEELHDKAEEAVKESERRLRMIVEATPVAVVISKIEDGFIVFTNSMTPQLVGLPVEDFYSYNVTDFYVDPAQRSLIIELLNKNGYVDHYEVEFKRKNGSRFWADISMRHLVFNDQPCVLAAWNDITHLKELNEAAPVVLGVGALGEHVRPCPDQQRFCRIRSFCSNPFVS